MRRKAHNRLWTLLFTLLLCGAGTASLPQVIRADMLPGDPSTPPPPNPQAGDPDWPTGGARAPKPDASHGSVAKRDVPVRQDRMIAWMLKVRMAFVAGFRSFF